MASQKLSRGLGVALCVVALASSAAWAAKSEKAAPSDAADERSAQVKPSADLLIEQVDALRQENQDLSLRLAALEEAATPKAEDSADRWSRLSIAVLGAATLLLALRVRKLK